MERDLRFWRKRWWGFYPIALMALPSALGFMLGGLQRIDTGNIPQGIGCLLLSCVLVLLIVALYAPWTCHWAARALGGITCCAYLAYLVSEVMAGKWVSVSRSSPSAFNALLGFLLFGVGGWMVARWSRESICPYGDDGTYLGTEVVYTVTLGEAPSDEEARANEYRSIEEFIATSFPTVRVTSEEWLDAVGDGRHGCLIVTVPRCPQGEVLWEEVRAELASRGLSCVKATL
jgi:hypothetical protein